MTSSWPSFDLDQWGPDELWEAWEDGCLRDTMAIFNQDMDPPYDAEELAAIADAAEAYFRRVEAEELEHSEAQAEALVRRAAYGFYLD